MEVSQQDRREAIERFVTLAGVSEEAAAELVDAALGAAVDQAFELMIGTGPIPTAMTAHRANLIRYACLRANRILTQREVELLFRIPASAAKTILTNARATYEQELRQQSLARMREDARAEAAGSADEGLRWRIVFTEGATLETAWSELTRLHIAGQAELHATQRYIEIPRQVSRAGATVDTLDRLGLKAPSTA